MLCLQIFAIDVISQDLALEWGKSWGGKLNESGNIIKSDGYGNIYVGGVFEDTLTYTLSNVEYKIRSQGNGDIFLAKLNSTGEIIFFKTIGGKSDDQLKDMYVDAFGSVFICGNFRDNIDFNYPTLRQFWSKGDLDFFIAHYDAKGNYVFAKTFGNVGIDQCLAIKVDMKRNIYVCGFFSESMLYKDAQSVSKTIFSIGKTDAFYAKLNFNGEFLWIKSYNSRPDKGLSMDVDLEGNVFIAGIYQGEIQISGSSGNLVVNSAGSPDVYFAKFNNLGEALFLKSIGGTGTEDLYQLSLTRSGEIVLTGYFQRSIDMDPSTEINILKSELFEDGFIAAYTAEGAFRFAQRFSITSDDGNYKIVADEDDNIYLSGSLFRSGSFSGFNGRDTILNSFGYHDIFIAKYLNNGTLQSVNHVGSVNNEIPNSITKGIGGKLYLTGSFEDSSNFTLHNSFVLSSNGKRDIFIFCLSKMDRNDTKPGEFSLSGVVHTGNTLLPDGIIHLLEDKNSKYVVLKTTFVFQGDFYFENLNPGVYKLLAVAYGEESNNFEPTYYVNKRAVGSSDSIFVLGNTYGVDLWMQQDKPTKSREDATNGNLQVYPNPMTADDLNIKFISDFDGVALFIIRDIEGKVVLQKEINVPPGTQTVRIMSKLRPQGLYLGTMHFNGNTSEFLFKKD
jgi:hypothetical protein